VGRRLTKLQLVSAAACVVMLGCAGQQSTMGPSQTHTPTANPSTLSSDPTPSPEPPPATPEPPLPATPVLRQIRVEGVNQEQTQLGAIWDRSETRTFTTTAAGQVTLIFSPGCRTGGTYETASASITSLRDGVLQLCYVGGWYFYSAQPAPVEKRTVSKELPGGDYSVTVSWMSSATASNCVLTADVSYYSN